MINYNELYRQCSLCPRKCGIDRTVKTGFCGESDKLSIDSALLHNGEEPCISTGNGSGTIFFTGCGLRCSFCQNMEISQTVQKKNYYSAEEFISIIRKLESLGAANINFVTPDHFMPHIITAVKYLKKDGFKLPFIYNCSGYETIQHLEMVSEAIDIFLVDYKFADKEAASRCINTPDYPEVALNAIRYLVRHKGNLELDESGSAISGVLIRHLVMPGFLENTKEVINEIYLEFGHKQYLSIMSQYTPDFFKGESESLQRHLHSKEYGEAVELVRMLGFPNVYIQDIDPENDPYVPDFAGKKMFDNW